MFLDAIENDPENNPMRQIPLKSGFSSSIWISELGVIRRRYYNSFNETWRWGNIMNPHVDDNGKVFVYLRNRKINIELLIAMAWLPNPKNRKLPKLKDISEGSSISNMIWSDDSEDDEFILENEEEESWKNIERNPTIFPTCESYQISSTGRIKNKYGEISEGTFVQDEKVVCLPDQGIVNIQDLVSQHFNSNNSNKKNMQPRLEKLLEALRNEKKIEQYAEENSIAISTVWSYIYDLFIVIDLDEADCIAKQIISSAAFKAMHAIFKEEKEYIFSCKAKEYMQYIDYLLCDDPDWKCNANRYHEIRLLKLLCQLSNR